MKTALGLVGIGKIAIDQHLPSIVQEPAFDLIAAASRNARDTPLVRYSTLGQMLDGEPELEAVSFCTPPQGRYKLATEALRAGKHVMLEKPPAATVCEVAALGEMARARGLTLFATWHSREAAGVERARTWLADKVIHSVAVEWKEDVRLWHPGQEWIFEPGGLGVFDPGINAISILTAVLPGTLTIGAANLSIPRNRHAPIAASIEMILDHNTPVTVELDFLYTGQQKWNILVQTDKGLLKLSKGGACLAIGDEPEQTGGNQEYARLYRRFAELIASGQQDVDLSPLQLTADAFLIGRPTEAAPFHF